MPWQAVKNMPTGQVGIIGVLWSKFIFHARFLPENYRRAAY